jgi:hypothetical protein
MANLTANSTKLRFCAENNCGKGSVLKVGGLNIRCETTCSEAVCCNAEEDGLSLVWVIAIIFMAICALTLLAIFILLCRHIKRQQSSSDVLKHDTGSAAPATKASPAPIPPTPVSPARAFVQEAGAAKGFMNQRMIAAMTPLAAEYKGFCDHPNLASGMPFDIMLSVPKGDESQGILTWTFAGEPLTFSTSITRHGDTVLLSGNGCILDGVLFHDGQLFGEVILNGVGDGKFKLHVSSSALVYQAPVQPKSASPMAVEDQHPTLNALVSPVAGAGVGLSP